MSDGKDTAALSAARAAGHEKRDINARPILAAILGMIAVLLVTFGGILLLYEFFARREAAESPPANPLAAVEAPRLPPAPRLQALPVQDLRALRSREDEILSGYAWLDRERGVVRIPIARAIDLLAERGLPSGAEEESP